MPNTEKASTPKPVSKKTKLAFTLLTYILAFSFFVSLATTTYIIYSDYRQGTNELDESIKQIKSGYQESVSYSLWNFDNQQIKAQLAGILNFPGVLNVYIETNEGLLHSTGNFDKLSTEKHTIELFYLNGERQYSLGMLYITLDYQNLYESLSYKALIILATQFFKTFSISLFILFIFQRLVTARLQKMSRWANQFNIENLDHELIADKDHEHHQLDEIDDVVNAINTMRISLKEDIKKREQVESNLKKSQKKLSIAIDNAELGLCEYNQLTNKFSGNELFAQHLGLEFDQLETLQQPTDWFLQLITGEREVEQKERLHQLLNGHMERICTELSLRCQNHKVKHFFATIQVSQWGENGLPLRIVFCLLDKTEQVNAILETKELNTALEEKVNERTEELTTEQIQSQAEISKLNRRLSQLESQKARYQNQQCLQPMRHALKQLETLISNNNHVQAKELINQLNEHIVSSFADDKETFDTVNLITETLTHVFPPEDYSSIELRLPFSLTLDSYQSVLQYCFERTLKVLINSDVLAFKAENLMVEVALKDNLVIITVQYANIPSALSKSFIEHWQSPQSNDLIILKMCQTIMQEMFEGALLVETQHQPKTNMQTLDIQLQFNINNLT